MPFSLAAMQLLSLVKSLRDTGHFTAVSVTRPFEFEGQRKVQAADRMIAALEGAAHLVVVVEQVTTLIPCPSCYICDFACYESSFA